MAFFSTTYFIEKVTRKSFLNPKDKLEPRLCRVIVEALVMVLRSLC